MDEQRQNKSEKVKKFTKVKKEKKNKGGYCRIVKLLPHWESQSPIDRAHSANFSKHKHAGDLVWHSLSDFNYLFCCVNIDELNIIQAYVAAISHILSFSLIRSIPLCNDNNQCTIPRAVCSLWITLNTHLLWTIIY